MPATSKAQQALMAIAEHNPGKVKSENRGVLKMKHSQLHDFAATSTKSLPSHAEPDADDRPGYNGPSDNDADDKVRKTFGGIGRGKSPAKNKTSKDGM